MHPGRCVLFFFQDDLSLVAGSDAVEEKDQFRIFFRFVPSGADAYFLPHREGIACCLYFGGECAERSSQLYRRWDRLYAVSFRKLKGEVVCIVVSLSDIDLLSAGLYR